MNLKHHFKFNIADAKQLSIALISSYGMWAATGFQKSISGLIYPIMGFITGGLASHNSPSSPDVLPDSHIQTPYANNINDGSSDVPPPIGSQIGTQQTFQNVKIIPKNDKIGGL